MLSGKQVNIILTSQWPRWRLKSPASRLFTQSFIRTQIKENIKAPRDWPLCGEFTGTGEFPAQRASNAENVSIWWRHHVSQISTPWSNNGKATQHQLMLRRSWNFMIHKSHNAPVPYPTIHHSEQMCTFLFWIMHCGAWDRYIMGFMKLVIFMVLCYQQKMRFKMSSSKWCPFCGGILCWISCRGFVCSREQN